MSPTVSITGVAWRQTEAGDVDTEFNIMCMEIPVEDLYGRDQESLQRNKLEKQK